MAAGLPVVASRWQSLEELNTPAVLVNNKRDFASHIERAARLATPCPANIAYAAGLAWSGRAEMLLRRLYE